MTGIVVFGEQIGAFFGIYEFNAEKYTGPVLTKTRRCLTMKILQINASARRDGANSTRVANRVVERLQAAHADAVVTRRDFASNSHPVLDEAALGALFTPAVPWLSTTSPRSTVSPGSDSNRWFRSANVSCLRFHHRCAFTTALIPEDCDI